MLWRVRSRSLFLDELSHVSKEEVGFRMALGRGEGVAESFDTGRLLGFWQSRRLGLTIEVYSWVGFAYVSQSCFRMNDVLDPCPLHDGPLLPHLKRWQLFSSEALSQCQSFETLLTL